MTADDLIAKAIRDSIQDWRREAEGSIQMAEHYDGQAERDQAAADAARATAAEHRSDAERAAQAAADLTEALAAYEATTGVAE